MCNIATSQVKVYMGDGWHLDFHHTHFDTYSPPDFYARVRIIIYICVRPLAIHFLPLAIQFLLNGSGLLLSRDSLYVLFGQTRPPCNL